MKFESLIGDPIRVEIKYTLGDYYIAVAEHAPQIFKDLGKAGPAWVVRKIVPPVACVAAIYTKKLRPHYQFEFTDEGVSREADSKKLEKSWTEIKRVRIYSTLFMIELEKGAMPVPFRFFTEQQLATLKAAFSSQRS